MKWLDNWIQRAYNRACNRDELMPVESVRGRGHTLSNNKRVASTYDDTGVINFTLYSATGGKIIEATRYDSKNDRERVTRYVVKEDDELGEVLSKVVTMEYLK